MSENALLRWQSLGLLATFGICTLSSGTGNMVSYPDSYIFNPSFYESLFWGGSGSEDYCISSNMILESAGNLFMNKETLDCYVQPHKKVEAVLNIYQIRKHVSTFEFEEDFEEL